MAVDIDYYNLLGVPREASGDAITEAVKKAMREWRKRTEAADLSVRQEAELRVKHIQDAREVLGNPAKRSQYDTRLTREGVARAELPAAGGAGSDWLEQAKGYLAIGDYHSAAYAAREATQSGVPSAESWWVRSRANAGLDKFDDALYEARAAVEMAATKPEYHFHLGAVSEEMSKWNQALSEYQEAARLEPGESMYQLAIGGVYAQNGMPEKALPIVEPVYMRNNDDESAAYYLATILIDLAEAVPAVKDSTGYVVTSAQEIAGMRTYLQRAEAVKHRPPDLQEAIRGIKTYLADMERKRFNVPSGMLGLGGLGGCSGVFGVVFILMLPIVLALLGFGAFSGGSPGWGFILLLAAAGLGYAWFNMLWVPGWKVNARVHR